ncbi:MAG: hypothetical protein R2746_16485 [Acidimicrobiales bacterium]
MASTLFGAIRRTADYVAVADDPAQAAKDGDEVLTLLLASFRRRSGLAAAGPMPDRCRYPIAPGGRSSIT